MNVKPKRCRSSKRAGALKAGFRSGFEHEFAKNCPVPYEYETERLPYPVTLTKHYTPDFILVKKDGTKMYLELKGRFTASDRTKMKRVKKCYPLLDIRMIFQMGTNRITRTSKTTYMKWCEQNGIPAYDCKGKTPHLPEEWRNEL
ncbi:putative exonuclease [Vibrio phage VP41s3]|nr:putative exonuclease [Vibrio phage VP41s3]